MKAPTPFFPPSAEDLEPRIISMGTTRVLRLKQVGSVFFVENMQERRRTDDAGKETTSEEWKVVAISKGGDDPMMEAHKFLADANIKVRAMIDEDMRRRRHA